MHAHERRRVRMKVDREQRGGEGRAKTADGPDVAVGGCNRGPDQSVLMLSQEKRCLHYSGRPFMDLTSHISFGAFVKAKSAHDFTSYGPLVRVQMWICLHECV